MVTSPRIATQKTVDNDVVNVLYSNELRVLNALATASGRLTRAF
jgi:hypothetical protein